MPANYDITNHQGDTFNLSFQLAGNLTAATPRMDLVTAFGASPSLSLTGASGITSSYTAPNTTFTVTVTAAASAGLAAGTIYLYDFQLSVGGVITTYLSGTFTQNPEATV
jgi:hypothetical protein